MARHPRPAALRPCPAVDDSDETARLIDWMPVQDWVALHPACGLTLADTHRARTARRLLPPLPVLAVALRRDLPAAVAAEVAYHRDILAETVTTAEAARSHAYEINVPLDDSTGDPHVLVALNAIRTVSGRRQYLLATPITFRLDLARDADAIAAIAAVDHLIVADADDPDGAVYSVQVLNPGGMGRAIAFASALTTRTRRRSA